MLIPILLSLAVATVLGLGLAVLGLRQLASSVTTLGLRVASFDSRTSGEAGSNRSSGPTDPDQVTAPVD